jgi:hypothetical protein
MKIAQPTPKILLYGNSILIESLTSKLHKLEGWEVKRTKGGELEDLDNVDFIVADLCDGTTAEALPMLCALPGIKLIGVDAIANSLTVLTGRAHPLSATQEVLDALKMAI